MLWIRIPKFLYLPDPDPSLFVRIRILPAKKVRKTISRVVLYLPMHLNWIINNGFPCLIWISPSQLIHQQWLPVSYLDLPISADTSTMASRVLFGSPHLSWYINNGFPCLIWISPSQLIHQQWLPVSYLDLPTSADTATMDHLFPLSYSCFSLTYGTCSPYSQQGGGDGPK